MNMIQLINENNQISKETLNQMKDFSNYSQSKKAHFFYENDILYGSTLCEYQLPTNETILVSVLASFKKPIEIKVLMENYKFTSNPIIQPDGKMKSSKSWKFTSFSNLFNELPKIFKLPMNYNMMYEESMNILKEYSNGKITKEDYLSRIHYLRNNNDILKNVIDNEFNVVRKRKKEKALNRLEMIFENLIDSEKMEMEEKDVFLNIMKGKMEDI